MKLGFLGGGKMAEAIISALVKTRTVEAHKVFVGEISADRRRTIKRRYGVNVYSKNATVAQMSDVIVLAVKPQQLDELLAEIAPCVTKRHLVLSIAAGKTIVGIEALLPKARVVRVMPNICCTVSAAVSAFCPGSKATAADRKTATQLLTAFGQAVQIAEEHFHAVTALSGSGPAFFAYLLDRMVDAAVSEGLGRDSALMLAEQTMLGTAHMLLEQKITPEALIESVTSAKGTTAAGMAVLKRSKVGSSLASTIRAAALRSAELSA